MAKVYPVRRAIASLLFVLFCSVANAQPANPPFVESLELVRSVRISRTVFEYTYVLRVRNPGAPVANLFFTASTRASATAVVKATVSVGSLAAGETRVSGDTLVVRQDRQQQLTPTSLTWALSFDQVPIPATVVSFYSAPIGPEGGTVALSGIASATLSANSGRPLLDLAISQVVDQRRMDSFDEEFPSLRRADTLIRIHSSENLLDAVKVDAVLPASLAASVQAGSKPMLYAELVQTNDVFDERSATFVLVPTTYDAVTRILTGVLPPGVFAPVASVETYLISAAGDLGPVEFDVDTRVPSTDQIVERGAHVRVSASMRFRVPAQLAPPVSTFADVRDDLGPRIVLGQPGQHEGLDIATGGPAIGPGPPIAAAADGTVIHAGAQNSCGSWVTIPDILATPPLFEGAQICKGANGGFGYYVNLRHAGGCRTIYGHLWPAPQLPSKGQLVANGAFLGNSDNTGRSTGPHLHFEYRGRDGKPYDPRGFLDPHTASPCLEGLSAVVKVGGTPVEQTRRIVRTASFVYDVELDTADPRFANNEPVLVNVAILDEATGASVDLPHWNLTLADTNLALRGTAVASNTYLPINSPNMAIDGTGDYWSAGNFPPQWIEIDLGARSRIWEIQGWVQQFPNGNTIHQVYLDGVLAFSWSGFTSVNDVLTHVFPSPVNARVVRVMTVSSPSWVGWNEIRVLGTPLAAP